MDINLVNQLQEKDLFRAPTKREAEKREQERFLSIKKRLGSKVKVVEPAHTYTTFALFAREFNLEHWAHNEEPPTDEIYTVKEIAGHFYRSHEIIAIIVSPEGKEYLIGTEGLEPA